MTEEILDMEDMLRVSFRWPSFPEDSFREEFILGAWHPSARLEVSCQPAPPTLDISSIQGKNWFMLSSRSPFQPNGNGLAHASRWAPSSTGDQATEAVAFRGYILEPPIHSWSEPQDIIDYWSRDHGRHNGVFTAIRIVRGGSGIEFISDAFGIMTLYHREFAGGLLFSTNSRFLVAEDDRIDPIACRILIQCHAVYGNRSLTEGVQRVPPGTIVGFREDGATERRWFSYSNLPTGNKRVTSAGLREVETVFQNAIDRCLQLQTRGYLLPLSSGYDSRRILAALHSRDLPLNALTVRALTKQNRDLDGHWAAVMAKELGFRHQVVELPQPQEFARIDYLRRLLTDAHVCEHTWFLAMHRYMPEHSCMVFDGLGGDVFNNTGFAVKELHTAEEGRKMQMILERVITDAYDRILSERQWPSAKSVRGSLGEFLKDLPDGRNKSDLAFLLMRSRSGPGMSFQRLIPAGHVTVYPYFDLDHAFVTLGFDPVEKLPPETLQARCLAEFWPRYYAFPGSRRIPPESKPGSPRPNERLWLACFRQLQVETGYPFCCNLGELLTTRGWATSVLAAAQRSFSHRVRWWLEPLLTLLARQATQKVCWTIASAQTTFGGVCQERALQSK